MIPWLIAIAIFLIQFCFGAAPDSNSAVSQDFPQMLQPRMYLSSAVVKFSAPFCKGCGDIVASAFRQNNTHFTLSVRRLDGLSWHDQFGLSICCGINSCGAFVSTIIKPSNTSFLQTSILADLCTVPKSKEEWSYDWSAQQKITKRVVRTYRSRQPENEYHYNAHNYLVDLNPEYEIVMFTDVECREFIKQHFSRRYVDAYDLLISPTFKADFFRYAYLSVNGGCYFDHKMILRVPLRTFIKPDDDLLVCIDADKHSGRVVNDVTQVQSFYNAIICAQQHDYRITRTLLLVVEKIEHRHRQGSEWSLTGPYLFYEAIHENVTDANIRFRHKFVKDSSNYHDYYVLERGTDRLIANKFFPQIKRDPKQTYGRMWRKGIIYYHLLHHYKKWKVLVYDIQVSCFSSTVISRSGRLILSFPLDLFVHENAQPLQHPAKCSALHLLFLNDETSEEFLFHIPDRRIGNITDMKIPFDLS